MCDIKDRNVITRLLNDDYWRRILNSFELNILEKSYLSKENLSLKEEGYLLDAKQKLLNFNQPKSILYVKVSEIKFNNTVQNILRQNKIIFVYQLLAKTEEELLKLRGIGLVNVNNIKMTLQLYNLDFACNCSFFPSDLVSWLPISLDAVEILNFLGVVTFEDLLNISFDVQQYLYRYGILSEILLLVKNLKYRFENLDPDLAILDYFDFSEGMMRGFKSFGIKTMGQLIRRNTKSLLSFPGVGTSNYHEILDIVHKYGYLFADEHRNLESNTVCRCLELDDHIKI